MQILILAGRRRGLDPVAQAAGTRHKALVLVDGVPVLQRVVRCLRDACGPVPVFVSTEDPTLLEATRELRALADDGALRRHASGVSPAASVADFLDGATSPGPFLVTTADHALLTSAMVAHFLAAAAASPADLAAAVVEESLFRARFPAVRRTFVPLRGGAITGANLFWFRTREAARAARFWTRAESLRKRPWRLVALFGAGALMIAGGIYLKALVLGTPAISNAPTSGSASNRKPRGGCDLCRNDIPTIHCRVHELHLCSTCMAEHYDARSCAYVPSTRGRSTQKVRARGAS